MSDGTLYDIPAEVIAEHRATYFEDNSAEAFVPFQLVQPASLRREFALKNDEVLIEWASKKMSWKDIKPHAKVELPNNNEEDWPNAPKEIITAE